MNGLAVDGAGANFGNNDNLDSFTTPTAAGAKDEPASSPFPDNNSAPTISRRISSLQTNSHENQRRLVEYFLIVKSQETKTPEQERADYLKSKLLEEEEDVEDRNYSFFNFGNHDAAAPHISRSGSVDAGDDLSYASGKQGRRMSGSSVHTAQSKQPNQASNPNNTNRPAFSNDTLTFEEQFRLDWQTEFTPVISGRYPSYDHSENPLSESVTCFCHPNGFITPRQEAQMPKIHFFVTTGAKGQLMYGTCLTLWEPHTLERKKRMFQDDGMPVESLVSVEVYLPKVLCILSAWPFLTAFREFLTQLHRLTRSCTMTVPLERFIVNFCAEIPAPPPGAFEVQATISDSVIKLWSPPHNQPIPWVSLPFAHLFQCLDVDNVMLIWHALTLERQVLLTSTQLSLLTTCAEILKSLLFPMTWSHAYIPVLPHFMIAILGAPMPFLCGIDKCLLTQALMDLSPECIVVDLDKNVVSLGPQTPPLPPLPPTLAASFRGSLNDAAGMVFREVRCLSRTHDASNMGQHLLPHIKDMADAAWEGTLLLMDEAFHLYYTPEESRKNWLNGDAPDYSYSSSGGGDTASDGNVPLHIRVMSKAERSKLKKQSNWDAVQEAFFGTYVYMLRNYRKFLVFPTKRAEVGDNGLDESGGGASASDANAYGGAGFLTNQFIRSQKFDMQPFLKQLCQTQLFDNFVTKRLYSSGESDVLFFDQAIHKLYGGGQVAALLAQAGQALTPGAPNSRKGFTVGARIRNAANHRRLGSVDSITASGGGGGGDPTADPLLQSAGGRRLLKTVVPPEPSGADLPKPPSPQMQAQVLEFRLSEEGSSHQHSRHDYHDDDISVISTSSAGSYSLKSGRSGARSTGEPKSRKRHGGDKQDVDTYYYPAFPSELDGELLGEPRPLSSAVLAEFDRQRADAVRFRRKRMHITDEGALEDGSMGAGDLGQQQQFNEMHPFPEVATFSLFFQAFTALIGKELIQVAEQPTYSDKDTIMSTYDYDQAMRDKKELLTKQEGEEEQSLATATATVSTLGDGEQSLHSPQSMLKVTRLGGEEDEEDATIQDEKYKSRDQEDSQDGVLSTPDLALDADESQSLKGEKEAGDIGAHAKDAKENEPEIEEVTERKHADANEEAAGNIDVKLDEKEQDKKDIVKEEDRQQKHVDSVTGADAVADAEEVANTDADVKDNVGTVSDADADPELDETAESFDKDEATTNEPALEDNDDKSASSERSSVSETDIRPTETYESEYIKDDYDHSNSDRSHSDDDDRDYFPQGDPLSSPLRNGGPGRFRRSNSIGSYNSDYDDDADAYNYGDNAHSGPSKLDMFTKNLDTSFGVEELNLNPVLSLDGTGLAKKTLQGQDSMDSDDLEDEIGAVDEDELEQEIELNDSVDELEQEVESNDSVDELEQESEENDVADEEAEATPLDKEAQGSDEESANEEVAVVAPAEAKEEALDESGKDDATDDQIQVIANDDSPTEAEVEIVASVSRSKSEDKEEKSPETESEAVAADVADGEAAVMPIVADAEPDTKKKDDANDKDTPKKADIDTSQEDAALQGSVSFHDDGEIEVEHTDGSEEVTAVAAEDVLEKEVKGEDSNADASKAEDVNEDGDDDEHKLKVVVSGDSNEGLELELPARGDSEGEGEVEDSDTNTNKDAEKQKDEHTAASVRGSHDDDALADVELKEEETSEDNAVVEESNEDSEGEARTEEVPTVAAVGVEVTTKDSEVPADGDEDNDTVEDDVPPPPAPSFPFVVTSRSEAEEWMGSTDRSGANEEEAAATSPTEQQMQDAEEYLQASQKRVRSLVKHVSERALTSNLGKRINEKSAPMMRQVSDKAMMSPLGKRWSKSMSMQRTRSETGNDMAAADMDGSTSAMSSAQMMRQDSLSAAVPGRAKSRFTDKLTVLEMEEAKATAKAQLGLAFDILQMMRERTLKADPSVYQSLIGACGRCGDTERATQLLGRMHEDGIVADGVVYACLVSAFSAENAYKKKLGLQPDKANLPEWANGATLDMDWNSLRRQSVAQVAKQRISDVSNRIREGLEEDITDGQLELEGSTPRGMARFRKRSGNVFNSLRGKKNTKKKDGGALDDSASENPNNGAGVADKEEMTVTEPVLMQILLGENLLELVYSDILIEMDTESCPRCNKHLTDAEIVAGWKSADPQNYTTCCPSCTQTFVPHFCVHSSSPSFVGSRGPDSPLFCQRLSPWVLQKELRTVMMSSGSQGGHGGNLSSFRDEFLTTEWRHRETRNATLWWNLVVSFMRYRLPITFLLQDNFQVSLIAPTPSYEEGTD